MRLLVVDDDSSFREELAELLRADTHEVQVAPSVPKALESLEAQEYDVVLTDLKMPRHSGMELVREVRSRWPRTLVVMITGFATVETAVQAMKDGAFDYIRKPFRVDQVRQVLELARQEQRFQSASPTGPAPGSLARTWVNREKLDVLWFTVRPQAAHPGITVEVSETLDLNRLRERIEGFLGEHPRAGVLVDDAQRLLQGHRRAEVLELLGQLQGRLAPHGPLVLVFEDATVAGGDLGDVRAALMAPTTHAFLEALANPLRRAVLRRALEGPCTFSQAMEAAKVDDSPKLAFHLKKLVEEGLLLHQGETYRATPKGEEAARLLGAVDALPPAGGTSNAVIVRRPPA